MRGARLSGVSDPRTRARRLVDSLQDTLVRRLQLAATRNGLNAPFERHTWHRDDGRHGGGNRRSIQDNGAFARASVNVSAVHYDDLPNKRLASATALSAIVHPKPAWAPSLHTHLSWTALRDGRGYWRIMADLNPSNPRQSDAEALGAALKEAAGEHFEAAAAQGGRYFHIPALGRHRGVLHFYLEQFNSGDAAADLALASSIADATIACYGAILDETLGLPATADAESRQLAYHTTYLFQVLTLDRGTTSGLMVHSDNDVGIMGSLPPFIDRDLLESWRDRLPSPQEKLMDRLLAALPAASVCAVGEEVKFGLAAAVRAHYLEHPAALALQARGDVVPPTVQNHADVVD